MNKKKHPLDLMEEKADTIILKCLEEMKNNDIDGLTTVKKLLQWAVALTDSSCPQEFKVNFLVENFNFYMEALEQGKGGDHE